MVTPSSTLNILVTGAGAPGIRGTLYALRRNPDSRPVRIIGVDLQRDPVGRWMVDAFEPITSPESADYIDQLAAICRRHGVDLVVPQTTREIEVLSRHRDELREAGIPVMVSSRGVIDKANNKWRLCSEFERLGLPVPATVLARDQEELLEACEGLGYPKSPVVVKPPVSNGMRGVRILRESAWDVARFLTEKPSGLDLSLDQLIAVLQRGEWPELLVSEFLPGCEFTVDAFRGSRFEIAIPRRRAVIRSGITFRAETVIREDLMDWSIRAARALNLEYAFGFQFKEDANGVPRLLECNPRVQGTMVASCFAGANIIWFGVRELLGDPVIGLTGPLEEISFVRYWGGLGIQRDLCVDI